MVLLYYLFVNVIWGISPIFEKYLSRKINILSYIIIGSGIQFLAALFLMLYYDNAYIMKDVTILLNDTSIITGIFFITILLFISKYLYLYLYIVNNDKSIALVVILISIYPVLTLIFGYLYLNETITGEEFLGFILILLGIFLINYSSSNKLHMISKDV
jgi:drug/metabolite transporter (DMT)-like permease